ncbi:malonyl-CoA-(acyl-carrier-protein) transacylase [Burkholderiales bacterium]|nr:malonyl-CoA-(acyl-carrier-protein) transacylase [Burkholderiales bacterium]
MKLAFVFPGQGSQSVGMLGTFAGDGIVEEVLQRASAALGQDIGRLIAQGPAAELDLTVNTQPCLLTASVAMYRAWRAAGGRNPDVFAGHSLGEYAALVAAGALTLEDAVPLVRFRAQAMQDAVPLGTSGMAAILGLDDDRVRAACARAAAEAPGAVVEAVNFNAPAQVVIAGHTAALARACEIARELGAKRALPLPVSVAFHSSLLEPARVRLLERLSHTPVQRPREPVLNNIDVKMESDPQRIRDALARQVAGPVRWSELVAQLAAQGITHIVECGPGKVLTGLNKRIAPTLTSISISDRTSLHEALSKVGGAA